MATIVKPSTRYQPADWFTTNVATSSNAERSRLSSEQTRQEARHLENETAIRTKWDQHDNTVRLQDRAGQISKWKEHLEDTLAKLDREIEALVKSKRECEEALEAKNLPMDVVTECLTLREGRQEIDLVQDEVEAQLKKEKELIEKSKQALQERCSQAFEQLCVLQEARQQLLQDLQDKNVAHGIDTDMANLTEQSACISFKPDPLRVPKGSTTPQSWEDFSRYNKERAEQEMRASERLREAVFCTIKQTNNDVNAQQNATDYAFRKRINEFERAKDELDWQKRQLEDEVDRSVRDINQLEEAIRAKIAPQKLAETRLETRTSRPHVELCRDAPQYGLVDEVKQIEASRAALEEKLRQARHTLDNLEKNLHRVNDQIALKTIALNLDQRCCDSRQKLRLSSTVPRATSNTHPTFSSQNATAALARSVTFA